MTDNVQFPKSITDPKTNTTVEVQDHKMVFDLAAELNALNEQEGRGNFSLGFINWVESNQAGLQCAGGVRKPDGRCPTLADIAANSSLAPSQPPISLETQKLMSGIAGLAFDPGSVHSIVTNMFQAHKQFLDTGLGGIGGDQWSEFGYMHNYLKYSVNATDQVLNTFLAPAPLPGSMWTSIYQNAYFLATQWASVDGGLSRLAEAFHPLVDNITSLKRKVTKVRYDEDAKKVSLFWRDHK